MIRNATISATDAALIDYHESHERAMPILGAQEVYLAARAKAYAAYPHDDYPSCLARMAALEAAWAIYDVSTADARREALGEPFGSLFVETKGATNDDDCEH